MIPLARALQISNSSGCISTPSPPSPTKVVTYKVTPIPSCCLTKIAPTKLPLYKVTSYQSEFKDSLFCDLKVTFVDKERCKGAPFSCGSTAGGVIMRSLKMPPFQGENVHWTCLDHWLIRCMSVGYSLYKYYMYFSVYCLWFWNVILFPHFLYSRSIPYHKGEAF